MILERAIFAIKPGQAEDFRERPHKQQVFLLPTADERQQVRRLVEKFQVRLVHH